MRYEISRELLEIFDPTMMRRFQFVPIDSVGSVLVIAIAGLLSEELVQEIENQTGCTVQLFLAKMSEINAVLSLQDVTASNWRRRSTSWHGTLQALS